MPTSLSDGAAEWMLLRSLHAGSCRPRARIAYPGYLLPLTAYPLPLTPPRAKQPLHRQQPHGQYLDAAPGPTIRVVLVTHGFVTVLRDPAQLAALRTRGDGFEHDVVRIVRVA